MSELSTAKRDKNVRGEAVKTPAPPAAAVAMESSYQKTLAALIRGESLDSLGQMLGFDTSFISKDLLRGVQVPMMAIGGLTGILTGPYFPYLSSILGNTFSPFPPQHTRG